jgi:hypothetical protein
LGVNSGNGNDNLPPAIPPPKGNVPGQTPKPDTRRKSKRARQSGQKITPSEPVLPELKPRPNPPSVPPAQPTPFAQPPKSTETPLPKKPYPFKLVITLLVIFLLGLAGFGLFVLVSPDGRSIKVFTEPTSDRLDLTKQSNLSVPASPAVKPLAKEQKS